MIRFRLARILNGEMQSSFEPSGILLFSDDVSDELRSIARLQ
jgi:hypothetical protein